MKKTSDCRMSFPKRRNMFLIHQLQENKISVFSKRGCCVDFVYELKFSFQAFEFELTRNGGRELIEFNWNSLRTSFTLSFITPSAKRMFLFPCAYFSFSQLLLLISVSVVMMSKDWSIIFLLHSSHSNFLKPNVISIVSSCVFPKRFYYIVMFSFRLTIYPVLETFPPIWWIAITCNSLNLSMDFLRLVLFHDQQVLLLSLCEIKLVAGKRNQKV